jgi:hypothetical protein
MSEKTTRDMPEMLHLRSLRTSARAYVMGKPGQIAAVVERALKLC